MAPWETWANSFQAEDQVNVPDVRYNFTSIGNLQSVEPNTTIDTIGVLKEVGESNEIISKTSSKPFTKRELTLVDDTMHSVRLTVWGKTAESFDVPPNSVIAFKGVKVSDFGGRSLSLLSSGTMNVDPDIDEAHKLKGWYDASGNSDNFITHQQSTGTVSRRQEYKTIAQINDERIGMSGDAEYFTLKATIMYVKHETFAYPACASQGCNKKVVETEPGQWRCEKCDLTHPRPEWRYIMNINVSDHTGQMWLSGFDESGRDIMGMSANELVEMKENDETTTRADKTFADATCKTWVFRCRAKLDTFQDQERQVSLFPSLQTLTHANNLPQGPLPSLEHQARRLQVRVRVAHRDAQEVRDCGIVQHVCPLAGRLVIVLMLQKMKEWVVGGQMGDQ